MASEPKTSPVNRKGNKFKIDFGAIPDNALPAGEYTAVINKVTFKEGEKAPYLNWEFDILDEEFADRKVWMITSFADNALFRLKAVAASLGFEGMFELEIEEGTDLVLSPDFAGTEVSIKTSLREYQGQNRANIDSILDYFTEHHLGVVPDEEDEDEDDFEDLEDEEEDFDEFEDEDEDDAPEAVAPVVGRKKVKK
jgi:hypothetical protein